MIGDNLIKWGRDSLLMSGLDGSSADLRHPSRLKAILLRLVLLRVLVLSLILGLATWDAFSSASESRALSNKIFAIVAVIYIVSLVNAFLLRRAQNILRFGYAHVLIDVLLATVCMSVTNTTVGMLLYCVLIAASAVVLGSKGSVIVGALCGLGYGLFVSGMLPNINEMPKQVASTEVITVYLALLGIAVLSGYLARQLERMGHLASQTAQDLNMANEQQRKLFDDISEGIVILDLENTITSLNQAAKSILGLGKLDSGQFVGRPIHTLLKERGVSDIDQLLNKSGNSEIKLIPADRNDEIRVNCSVRPLKNDIGDLTGQLVVFDDVSHMRSIEQKLELHEQMTKLLAGDSNQPNASILHSSYPAITGSSEIMTRLLELVQKIAASDASVLVSGESGTGKELIARAIHATGSRANSVFLGLNCGAIPEDLIESELFGHKKGSFTGAVSDTLGLFRQANGGTIFLDEIGELPLHLQTKLLRVLQERNVRPVGDTRDYAVDVRVIAATNRDLKKEIACGNFREDLYYRLNVVTLLVPPLRDRKEDIPLLVKAFLDKYTKQDSKNPESSVCISSDALQCLMNYSYPGNIRELENIIERAVVLGGMAILPEHLPEEVTACRRVYVNNGHLNRATAETEMIQLPMDLESFLENIERQYLTLALQMSGGIKKDAADLLGLNFRSLRYRLKKYGLAEDSDTKSD